jgi:archaellum component FlaC
MAPVVVGLLIIAAIAGWLIYRPKPSPPVDAQIKSLDDRLQKLSARANTVQDGFTQGESQVDNDIKEVTNADKQRAHPQASTISLLKDLKELKGKFHEMASGDPYQLRALLKNDHKQSLDAIRKEAPGKPREDHEAKLSNALTKLDDDLRHQEDALSKLQNQKKELEAKVADVVKPVSAPPARAAAHAGDRPTEK